MNRAAVLPGAHLGAVLSRATLLSRGARGARGSPLPLTSWRPVLPSDPRGALLSWGANWSICTYSTLRSAGNPHVKSEIHYRQINTIYIIIILI